MRRALSSSTRILTAPRQVVCRRSLQCSNFSTIPRRSFAEEKLPMQERLRRKLWGTEKPPGLEDPYSKPEEETGAEVDMVDRLNYVEAFDARGLPIAGLEKTLGVWEVDSFAPLGKKPLSAEEVHRAVHRATVETFTVHLNGREAFGFGTPAGKEGEGLTERVQIEVMENGDAKFLYGSPEIEEAILRSLEEQERKTEAKIQSDSESSDSDVETDATSGTPEEAESASEASRIDAASIEPVADLPEEPRSKPEWLVDGLEGRGWINTPLTSSDITFLLTKRIVQLTGLRVPDVVSSQVKTVSDLIVPLVAPEKKKKLWDELNEVSDLQELKNVKVFGSKVRPLDKEKMIGRAVLRENGSDYVYEGIDDGKREVAWRGYVTYR